MEGGPSSHYLGGDGVGRHEISFGQCLARSGQSSDCSVPSALFAVALLRGSQCFSMTLPCHYGLWAEL